MGENNPDPRIASLTDPTEQLSQACLTFQRNWGLEVTGKVVPRFKSLTYSDTDERNNTVISASKTCYSEFSFKVPTYKMLKLGIMNTKSCKLWRFYY